MKFLCGEFSSQNLHNNIISSKRRISEKAKLPFEQDLQKRVERLTIQMGYAIDEAIVEITRIIEGLKDLYLSSSNILLDSQNINKF